MSPPAVSVGEFAVNQRAEQIIFEVEPGWVTAHVLITYAGAPEKFAWIVPVPEAPTELGVSPISAFGILDQATSPLVSVQRNNICPISEWSCRYHEPVYCGGGGCGRVGFEDARGDEFDGADGGAPSSDAPAQGEQAPVTVISEAVVGDYQTVTFSATQASAATQWLRDNGFIVNQTTSIYMEPYINQNMVFVAIKLIPGAGVKAVKPLKMKYRSAFPMIPLVLTAVASEPHLTVTAYVFGDEPYRPMGRPIVSIDETKIATNAASRNNYPMVLSRTIDDAGGEAFVIEYRGGPIRPSFNQQSNCCSNGYDFCGIGDNEQCECPADEFDRQDCTANGGDLPDGVTLVEALANRYPSLTRITTRVSPEEMDFDPMFEADHGAPSTGRLQLLGTQPTLDTCEGSVIEPDQFAAIEARQECASVYCGTGQCVTTAAGAACSCNAGSVAQRFLDLDGEPSVTCVPETPTCDLRAGGEQLPNACVGVTCGSGTCIDRNGVAVCECAPGNAASANPLTTARAPRCDAIQRTTGSPGAQDYSEPIRDLQVCAPPPPACGEGGWLVRTPNENPGVTCGNVAPPAYRTWEPPPPTCDGDGPFGCETSDTPNALLPALALPWFALGLVLLRRRRRRSM